MKHVKLDAEVRAFIDTMRSDWAKHPPLNAMPIAEARAVAEKVRARWTEGGPVMAKTEERTIETEAGPLRVRVYTPYECDAPAPALIYSHGGGFTLFSIDTHDRVMREYAARGRFAVIGVDYPLAPEAKFPVALDLITGLAIYLKQHAAGLGVDARRLAIGGDSAGGNLSVATCMRLRERGERGLIKAILSNYGGFAVGCSDEAEARYGGAESVLGREESYFYFGNYLNDPAQASDPFACPIHADLRGLPPTFLAIAECDIVAEHNIVMARRLREAGIDTVEKIYRGATHSFLEAVSISALARQAIADGADFIAARLASR